MSRKILMQIYGDVREYIHKFAETEIYEELFFYNDTIEIDESLFTHLQRIYQG